MIKIRIYYSILLFHIRKKNLPKNLASTPKLFFAHLTTRYGKHVKHFLPNYKFEAMSKILPLLRTLEAWLLKDPKICSNSLISSIQE